MKAYITKYALTHGITVVDATLCDPNIYKRMISVSPARGYGLVRYYGDEWHETPEAALADAEKRRQAKIKSLKKSLAKLEARTFEIQPKV